MELRKDHSHELASPHFSLQPSLEHLDEILIALGNDEAGFESLAGLMENRALISSLIIREANSARAATGRQIRSVRHAIALLGLERVRALLVELRVLTLAEWQRTSQATTIR